MIFPINKPHLIFFIAIPILILFGFLSGYGMASDTLDLNIHDTYFVIAHIHLIAIICILYGIIGFGYWVMQATHKKLSPILNWIHIGVTLGGTLIVWILTQFYRTGIMAYDFNNYINFAITLTFSLIFLGQIIYLINILIGIMKRQK